MTGRYADRAGGIGSAGRAEGAGHIGGAGRAGGIGSAGRVDGAGRDGRAEGIGRTEGIGRVGLAGAGGGVRGDGGAGVRGDAPADSGDRAAGVLEPPVAALVRIRDLAGRPRGVGFLADHHGTLLTSHEAVDGLARFVLRAPGGRTRVIDARAAGAVLPLPGLGLAIVRTEGLEADPLPLTARERIDAGTYVMVAAGRWREARVLASAQVTYTATEGCHLLDDVIELAIGTAGRDALRPGGGAAGGPVLDARTGAVLGVLGTALRSGRRDDCFAVPLRTPAHADGHVDEHAHGHADGAGGHEDGPENQGGDEDGREDGPEGQDGDGHGGGCAGHHAEDSAARAALDRLLARNAATVPAYGADLNLAAVLELTATSVGQDGPPSSPGAGTAPDGHAPPAPVRPVERPHVTRELAVFTQGPRSVLGLVGPPGSGRTTELAALAARRGRDDRPVAALWLRGADLRGDDACVADAARRALERAARIVAASRGVTAGALGDLAPERLAGIAARSGRPLLLLLDGPEEMPPLLAHRQTEWTGATAAWLRATGVQLVVACREEYWEHAGAVFPADLLHSPADPPGPLPPCVRLTGLTSGEARLARARHGVPDGALTGRDARHPLALRLLGEVRSALPSAPPAVPVDRHDLFAAHLDLMCLRVAVRLAAANGVRGTAVRRLATRVAGQVHEAARRSLGPGQGAVDRASFEAVFPWGTAPARLGGGTGWASAVLAEGLLVPAGDGYRFAHEELADWLQGTHLDLEEALHALVHRPRTPGGAHPLPVPHHRVGPVAQALLLYGRQYGPRQLSFRLRELADALDLVPTSWWAARLLAHTLGRVPDATPYREVLRLLAERVVAWRRDHRPVPAEFAPAFWTDLPLAHPDRLELLRHLVLADGAREPGDEVPGDEVPGDEVPGDREHREAGGAGTERDARINAGTEWGPADGNGGERYLDAVARLLAAEPTAVQPCLTHWFDDERPLPAAPHATVATAAQALLHTHRHGALDDLTEALAERAHPRADELLAVLAEEEPSAVCRAVDRWARDGRPGRRDAAMALAPRAARHARSTADRALLRHAAETVLEAAACCPDCGEEAGTAAGAARGDAGLHGTPHGDGPRRGAARDSVPYDAAPRERAGRSGAVHGGVPRQGGGRSGAAYDGVPETGDGRGGALYGGVPGEGAGRGGVPHDGVSRAGAGQGGAPYGGALVILVLDPDTRDRYLPRALRHCADGDPRVPAAALVPALATHPGPVLDAFRTRLRGAPDTGETFQALAGVTSSALARRVAVLVRETAARRPDTAEHVAAYVGRWLDRGPTARSVLLPLVSGLLGDAATQVRTALAGVLGGHGTPSSHPLRRELLDLLLAREEDPAVLFTVLRTAAQDLGERDRPEPSGGDAARAHDPATGGHAQSSGGATVPGDGPTPGDRVDSPSRDTAPSDGQASAGHTLAGHALEGHTSAGHTLDGHTSAGHTSAGHASYEHAPEGHAGGAFRDDEVRGLVHRTGLLLGRTPEGAARFDAGLVDLARHVPGFAARMARWTADGPDDWTAVVGPGTRRLIEVLARVRVPA